MRGYLTDMHMRVFSTNTRMYLRRDCNAHFRQSQTFTHIVMHAWVVAELEAQGTGKGEGDGWVCGGRLSRDACE